MILRSKKSTRGYAKMTALFLGMFGTSVAFSQVSKVPRGPVILPQAANCQIGEFSRTSKAGRYNALCHVMKDAEKCFAFVRGHIKFNGDVRPVHKSERNKMRYCMDVLTNELTK